MLSFFEERRKVDPAAGAAVVADVVGVERADDVGRRARADRGDDLVVVDAADDADGYLRVIPVVLGDDLLEDGQLVAGAPPDPDRQLRRRRAVHICGERTRDEHERAHEQRHDRCATSHSRPPEVETSKCSKREMTLRPGDPESQVTLSSMVVKLANSMTAGRAIPPHAQEPQRAHRARRDPQLCTGLPGRDLAAGRHLEADRLARAAVAARRRPRPRGGRRTATARATARSSSSRCRRPPSCSGLDLGARFVRGAICDLTGDDARSPGRRARPNDTADAALEAICPSRVRCWTAPTYRTRSSTASCVGVPGAVAGATGRIALADERDRARGRRRSPRRAPLATRTAGHASRTTSTSLRSASSGAESREASTTSCSSRSAPASARASSCAASCTGAGTAPRASSTTRAPGSPRTSIRAPTRSAS